MVRFLLLILLSSCWCFGSHKEMIHAQQQQDIDQCPSPSEARHAPLSGKNPFYISSSKKNELTKENLVLHQQNLAHKKEHEKRLTIVENPILQCKK